MLYLLAGNGAPNFGDELLVQYWLKFYRNIGYDGPITVDGKGASATAALLRNFANVDYVKTLPRHADGMEGSYADFYEQGVEYARSNLSTFEDVKGFHFLGGGYACANWRNATRMLGAVVEIGQRLSIPVAATGLGIAPFRTVSPADAEAWRKIVGGIRRRISLSRSDGKPFWKMAASVRLWCKIRPRADGTGRAETVRSIRSRGVLGLFQGRCGAVPDDCRTVSAG